MRHTLQGERAQLLRGRSYLHYLRRTLPYLFKSPTESAATAAGRSSRRGLNKLLELHLSEMQLGRAKQPPPQQGDPKTPNPSRRFRRSSNEFLRKSDAQQRAHQNLLRMTLKCAWATCSDGHGSVLCLPQRAMCPPCCLVGVQE